MVTDPAGFLIGPVGCQSIVMSRGEEKDGMKETVCWVFRRPLVDGDASFRRNMDESLLDFMLSTVLLLEEYALSLSVEESIL